MTSPIILYRNVDLNEAELNAARKYFSCTDSRLDIKPGQLVVGRYAVLPFYAEQERDVQKAGATLINTYDQHLYVADLRRWYADLKEPTELGSRVTPKTWCSSEEMMSDKSYDGPYVVKGITNSKKHLWKTHMFAQNKQQAIQVMMRLQEDSLINQQPIVFREYVPLMELGRDINNMPISKEFRFFFCYGELLCGAFYWSSYVEDLQTVPDVNEVPLAFLGEVSARIASNVNFYVIDVAQTATGSWMVVELNDGQMSGLSENDPDVLYRRLKEVIRKQ